MAVGRRLLSELEPDVVLRHIVEEAQAITGARYAALGVLNDERTEIERFITLGIDQQTARDIGEYPHGRGVLGVLIEEPRPLRLKSVGVHPRSFGFPSGHPPMESFLGVPVIIRGHAWGNLYLTEKEGGAEFTDADLDAVLVLAQFAATAVENARIYSRAERGRQELQQAVLGLEAAHNIADAIGTESDLDRILELVVKRGRALIDAMTVLILLRSGEELVVAAGAGLAADQIGRRFPIAGTTSGSVLESGLAVRIDDVPTQLPDASAALKLGPAKTALIVPMFHRGNGLGVLMAFDRGRAQAPFTAADEQLMNTFAASAASAVAMSRSVEADRLRSTIAAAESERKRWSRELHDQTLQALAALRVQLSTARRQQDPERMTAMISEAIDDIDLEVKNLRAIITDLRPALLDDLGLTEALEALIERRTEQGLRIDAQISLRGESHEELSAELQTTVYRLVQEALANVIKHARASAVKLRVRREDELVAVEISDDGTGFDTGSDSDGFGLTGMRERVGLAGGTLSINSGAGGTTLQIRLPVAYDA